MFKNFNLTKNNTIKYALKKLQGEYQNILTVVDKKKSLLGIVSSGDLRRAILSGYNINDKIEKIYNRKVSYIFEDELIKKKIW